MGKRIIVQQVKSTISSKPSQRLTMRALGLRKINSQREFEDTKVLRGMIAKVSHMVKVTEI